MVDNLKPEDRRKTMRAVKGKGTKLEKRLFSMLAGMRLKGWRKNAGDIIGKPDVVFDDKQVAVFIDGCFWHGCPHCNRKMPEANRDYWEGKIRRNVERDQKNKEILISDGWRVIRIWEHEIRKPEERSKIRSKIRQALTEGEPGEYSTGPD
jgi:DNA mismatch endonuclease (patch repair protein)